MNGVLLVYLSLAAGGLVAQLGFYGFTAAAGIHTLAWSLGIAVFALEDYLKPVRMALRRRVVIALLALVLGGFLSAVFNAVFETSFFDLLGRAAVGWAWALFATGMLAASAKRISSH